MHRLDADTLDEIRSRIDIVEVISDYVPLRRAGKDYVGLCPFHQERTPSFTVSPDKQMFYCFGCQVGGDVFTFLMKREGWSFPEAVAELARRAGVALPERPLSPAEARRRDERERLWRVLEMAAAFFRHALQSPAGAAARAYLAGRGLDPATWERYGLGYAPAGWDALLQALGRRGVPAELMERAGLVQRRPGGGYYDRFRHRVMFPIRDPRGRVVGFGGRTLGDEEPKYLNSPETPVFNKRRLWFGLDLARPRLRETGVAVVVEGYLDAIAIDRAGIGYAAVASLGTSLSEEQAALLARYASEVVIAYDGDAAGQRATLRGLELFADAGLEVRVAELPAGRDPDEVLRSQGADALRRYLDAAVPVVEYRFRHVVQQFDTTTVRGRAAAAGALAPWLARVRHPIERAEYVRRYAAALGIEEAVLWQEVRRAGRVPRRARPGAATGAGGNNVQAIRHTNRRVPAEDVPSGVARAERGLLALVLQYPAWREVVAARLEPGDWQTPVYRFLFELARAEQVVDGAIDPGRLLARLHALRTGTGNPGGAAAETAAGREVPDPVDGAGGTGAAGTGMSDGEHTGNGAAEEAWPGPEAGTPVPLPRELAGDPQLFDRAASVLAGMAQAAERVDPGEVERILDDYIKTLKKHSLWKIQRRIAQLEASGQQVPVDLVAKFQLLSAQLKGRAGG